MNDLIDRQAAIDMLNRLADDPWNANANTTWSKAYGYAAEMIEELPSAEPERKKGKWEVCGILDYAQRPTGRKILRCPFCGYLSDEFRSRHDYYYRLTNFCPNCGAEMVKGEEDE